MQTGRITHWPKATYFIRLRHSGPCSDGKAFTLFEKAPPRPPHRRVVVTGIGLVTPLGNNRNDTWTALVTGRTGISPITSFPTDDLPIKIAASVKNFSLPPGQSSTIPEFINYAVAAADEALTDALLTPTELSVSALTRFGVSVGVGIPHLPSITAAHELLAPPAKARRLSPHTVPRMLTNMAAGAISIRHKLKGPNLAPATACAAGAHAISDGFRLVQRGDADMVLAGGAEAAIHPISIAGFARARALAKEPAKPFDVHREGFTIGEGAGILVLEELDHALQRGAQLYAEIRGVGLSGDGWHVTSPHPTGEGAASAVRLAIELGGLQFSDIDYVSAHATGTIVGDRVEAKMLKDLFEQHGGRENLPLVSSAKGAIGHLLGAAGAVETALCCMSVREAMIPPTVGLTQVEKDGFWKTERYVPQKGVRKTLEGAVCNSFGFGGTNVAISLTRCE